MTTPEDQKAAQCPFCGSPAQPVNCPSWPHVKCSNTNCKLHAISVPIDQWNTRPREKELEEELAAANEYNDTDRPLSEVMAAISDAVMDFKPDVESVSAGTLIERVETAAELARKASERERRLEDALREAKTVVGLADAIAVCGKHRDNSAPLENCDCFECQTAKKYAATLTAINAALEEKR